MGSWKDPFLTLTFPSKVIFIIGSWLLFIIHLGVVIGDLYHFLDAEEGKFMSFKFTVSLLVKTHLFLPLFCNSLIPKSIGISGGNGQRNAAIAALLFATGDHPFFSSSLGFSQFSHVTSFYWALLASIYTLQADDGFLTCLALTSLGKTP
ncbi:uncharacterized protein PHA67_000188 [Liasis olivaceus]